MTDFETLGAFYLGKRYDLPTRARQEDYVLYDAKDLTTHAVIIGMTGSGKTGLGIGLLEEALIDKVPVIAIDPKGDLGNLALRFPSLAASDFRPWIDAQQAANAGASPDEFAAKQASLWKDGLAGWGEDSARIQRLVDAADVTVYTPGSTAGTPLSLLRAFVAPPAAIRDDSEALRERVDATATSVLALLGIDADPISSREHILLANLLSSAWSEGRDLDLAGLIGGIQSPPFNTVGVMPLDTVFPPKDRMELAMRLNNLLAAPGFQNWLKGDPLDTANLLYDANGRPKGSIISIAHLGDAERMFFMTLLLADILAWVRAQPGTGSLRAILYIDELFGYMPPVANPPSKVLLLTLLKQARAYGLGVVLATQNPVDLDYRGLSNTGTWFIGRLQTERDKMRVMDGLEGASGGQPFDRTAMEQTIAGLGKRVFLLHSVHEPAPITFETRWTMSYLAGPMTREQIKQLSAMQRVSSTASGTGAPSGAGTSRPAGGISTSGGGMASLDATPVAHAPVLPPDVPQFFIPPRGGAESISYHPAIIGVADVSFASAKYNITEQRRVVLIGSLDDGPISLEWESAERVELDPSVLERGPRDGAAFGALPKAATTAKSYPVWTKSFQKWLTTNEQVALLQSTALKLTSAPGEHERDFRIRLQQKSREGRDAKVETMRGKYATKLAALQERIRRAEQAVQREQAQASQAKMDTAISVGGAILGAIFGRGKIGAGTVGKVGTAARGMGRAAQQSGDVTRASESVEALRQQYADLEATLQGEIDALGATYDAQAESLESIAIKAKSGDVHVQLVALAWVPYAKDASGMTTAAWR
ncbi:MAG: ATP-binding protein [Gemmatimonadaceae bacterium]|jgi:Skp family chaperone for outer membrane proteins|nr:ATP-binding protein [Gemmatimonadaceae bacterium]